MKTFQAFTGPRNASGLHPTREQCAAQLPPGTRVFEAEISVKDTAQFRVGPGKPTIFGNFIDAYNHAVENNLDTATIRIVEQTRGEFYNDIILGDRMRFIGLDTIKDC